MVGVAKKDIKDDLDNKTAHKETLKFDHTISMLSPAPGIQYMLLGSLNATLVTKGFEEQII